MFIIIFIGGRLYNIVFSSFFVILFSWKIECSFWLLVFLSVFLVNYVIDVFKKLFVIIYKCLILINIFGLVLDEVVYIYKYVINFKGGDVNFDWNVVSLFMWKRF